VFAHPDVGEQRVLEVHILDFDREIYGETMTVTFLQRLRDERKFGSLGELVEQLGRDRAAAHRA